MKGKSKTVLAVLALPAIWALGAKTGKGKLFRWWLVLSLYYSPVAIVKEIAKGITEPTVKTQPVASQRQANDLSTSDFNTGRVISGDGTEFPATVFNFTSSSGEKAVAAKYTDSNGEERLVFATETHPSICGVVIQGQKTGTANLSGRCTFAIGGLVFHPYLNNAELPPIHLTYNTATSEAEREKADEIVKPLMEAIVNNSK